MSLTPVARARCPQLIFIAGSNGSGKSTLWAVIQAFIAANTNAGHLAALEHMPYLNVDDRFKEMQTHDQNAKFSDATKWRNAEVNRLIAEKKSFVVETVFDEAKLGYLKKAQKAGFETTIYFMGVASADMAVKRVKDRVAAGGHDVEEHLVRQKWSEALVVAEKAVARADHIIFYDNSTNEGPEQVAAFSKACLVQIGKSVTWVSEMPSIEKAIAAGIGHSL